MPQLLSAMTVVCLTFFVLIWAPPSQGSGCSSCKDSKWPSGTYGLPKTNTGCPADTSDFKWKTGWRKQDTEDTNPNNTWSPGLHFPTFFYKNNLQQHFCMKMSATGSRLWPAGNYCIFKKNTCPQGFYGGSVKWDDQDHNIISANSGVLPDGIYDRNTLIQYCCRQDGNYHTEISLPSSKAFYLFRFTSECQRVKNMIVRAEYFHWDDENTIKNHVGIATGSHPYDDGGQLNHRLHYCYYSPKY